MALSITHSTVVVVPDDGTSPVGTDEWNDDHSLSGTLDDAQLADVNGNVGTFGSATKASIVTVDAKGRVTAASESTVTPAASDVTGGGNLTKTDDTNVTLTLGGTPAGALLKATSITVGWTGTLAASRGGTGISSLGTGVATALGVNTGSAGAMVLYNGALGTPSSGALTNCSGLPLLDSTGSAYVQIDSNNDTTNAVFEVRADSATPGGGSRLFRVDETGQVTIGTGGVTPNRKLYVTQVDTDATGSATPHSAFECRQDWQPGANSDGNPSGVYGTLWFNSAADFTGHGTALRGNAYTIAQGGGGSVNVTFAAGAYGRVRHEAAGTITSAAALHADGAQNAGSGTITNAYSLYCTSQTVATNNYGVFFENNPGGGSFAAATNISISTKVTGTGSISQGTAGGTASLSSAGTFSVTNPTTFSQLVTDRSDAHGSSVTVGIIGFRGRDSASNTETYGRMLVFVSDNTSGSEDSDYRFDTMVAGTLATRMTVGQGVQVGSPTGGDKGAGTLNATAVYDDNTLLTCYPFDAALDGAVDVAKWDGKVPDRVIPADPENGTKEVIIPRQHDPLRKFIARLGGKYDPLDIDKYTAHWRDKRHLTSLPNEANFDPVKGGLSAGEWIQRLIETVEIQAIHIGQLNDRLKVVEAGGK